MSTENTQNQAGDNQNETPEQKAGKIKKRFEANMNKLKLVLGKDAPKSEKIRLGKSQVFDLVTELFKEETEAAVEKVKSDLKINLKAYIEMTRAIEAKRKELEQLEQQKMKEFNDSIEKVFNQMDGIPDYNSLAADALGKVVEEKPTPLVDKGDAERIN